MAWCSSLLYKPVEAPPAPTMLTGGVLHYAKANSRNYIKGSEGVVKRQLHSLTRTAAPTFHGGRPLPVVCAS
jgi:hypothetical protein